ncbi:MAG: class I SAM-dependent methyltransferase [Candidatus Anstonellales archaeon]
MNLPIRSRYDDTVSIINNIIISRDIKSILDLGCGDGHYHQYLYCKDIIGIDISGRGDNIVNHDITMFPYPVDRSFDMIMLLDILEHVFDPIKVLEGIRQYCNKYILVSVPNKNCIDDIIYNRDISIFDPSNMSDFDGRWCYDHIRFFNLKSIRNLIEHTGYSILYVTGSNCLASRIISKIIYISESNPLIMSRKIGEEFIDICPNITILAEKRSF